MFSTISEKISKPQPENNHIKFRSLIYLIHSQILKESSKTLDSERREKEAEFLC